MESSARAIWVVYASLALFGCAHGNDDLGSGGSSTNTTTSGGAPGTGGTAGAGASSQGGAPTTTTTGGAGGMSTTETTTTTTGGGGPGPGGVFFSEYVEGSGNNKAVEIVNTGTSSFALGNCVVDRYQNGASSPAAPTITLDSVTLGSNQVFVLCNSSFSQSGLCDQLDPNLSHTGNDAIVLVCNGSTLDAFGEVGVDTVWGTSPVSSQDATLRRKCSVNQGDSNENDPFNPTQQWDGYPIDTLNDLGIYSCP